MKRLSRTLLLCGALAVAAVAVAATVGSAAPRKGDVAKAGGTYRVGWENAFGFTDAFDPTDQPILEAVSAKLEGKTEKQKNPHPKGSLAFASWVVGRLGGWTGYYGKPGPKVMRRGYETFQAIKCGAYLGLNNV